MPHAVEPTRAAEHGGAVMSLVDEVFPPVEGFYVDLHKNPELSHQEHRTASAVAEWLRTSGFEVHTGVGGTGVVGLLRNGDGPTVMLRADMDALPVEEKTGLPYASTARGTDPEGDDVPVMHACGHDVHTACLVGAADLLAQARDRWQGTLMVVAQPAEETIDGALGMLRDGLYTRFGRPDVVLGQHVGPQPAGLVTHRPGVILAAGAVLRVRVHGVGGHASRPHTTVDPVVIAANIVTRLQTVVAREVSPGEMAVATVGVLRAGSKANIIPDEAYLEINTRALNAAVADQLHEAIRRIVKAEAAASGAPREPEVDIVQRAGTTENDPGSTGEVMAAHRAYFGDDYVIEMPEPFTGSEDVGEFGLPGDPRPVPYVYWFIGGTPHDVWQQAPGETPYEKLSGVPSNHSPYFAPDREPTLRAGLASLTVAALTYLGTGTDAPAAATGAQAPLHAPAPPMPPTEGLPGYDAPPEAAEAPVSTRQADMDALLAMGEPGPAEPASGGQEPWDLGADPAAPEPPPLQGGPGGHIGDGAPHQEPDPFAAPPPAPQAPEPYPADPYASEPFGAPPQAPPPPQGPPIAAPPPSGPPVSAPPPSGAPFGDAPPPQGEPYPDRFDQDRFDQERFDRDRQGDDGRDGHDGYEDPPQRF